MSTIATRLLFVGCLLLPEAVSAIGADSVGTTSGSFFKMASAARPVSMGQAYVALADDIAALHYNPAGLENVQVPTVQASHTVWFQGAAAEHLSGALPLAYGTLGLNFSYLSFPSQTTTEQIGNSANPLLNYKDTGSFSPGAMSMIAGYGAPLGNALKVGAGLKVISENPMGFSGPSATGIALDLGILGKTPVEGLAFGFSAQNLGFGSQVSGTNFGSAMLLRGGASYRTMEDKLIVTSELDFPNDTPLAAAVGLEYALVNILYPRVGLRYDGIYNPWSAGLGIRVNNLRFDLATVPMGDLGQTYRASVEWSFGSPAKQQVQKTEGKPAAITQSAGTTGLALDNLKSYPNPFWSRGTWVYYDLNTDADIEFVAFFSGALVRHQKLGHVNAGTKRWIYFNPLDSNGKPLPMGEYQYRVIASKGATKIFKQGSFRRGPEPVK